MYLHPKHGVNPTICKCFWCGKDKNELALLGASYNGEAPMHMVVDREPCDECKEFMALGITVMESADGKTPTGRWIVIREDAEFFNHIKPLLREQVLKARKFLVDTELFDQMIPCSKGESHEKA